MALRPRIRSHADLRLEIARLRKVRGLTQLELDDLAGLQDGYIGKIECGTRGLGKKSLEGILGALGVGLNFIRASASTYEGLELVDKGSASYRAKKEMWRLRAIKGGVAKARRMTREERHKLGRDLAAIRWRKWRALRALKKQRGDS